MSTDSGATHVIPETSSRSDYKFNSRMAKARRQAILVRTSVSLSNQSELTTLSQTIRVLGNLQKKTKNFLHYDIYYLLSDKFYLCYNCSYLLTDFTSSTSPTLLASEFFCQL